MDLTLAELTISFKDGTSEKTTFNLTTDVNSPDNIQFTVALLNPKVGSYSLKVQATDSAGNASGTAGHVSRWDVVSAKPVDIDLQPGWNMISLPFQPGNPAINSVIPSKHPADIVMTFDGPTQTWLVSRRDAESGLFVGDIAVMTASTAYFVRTTKLPGAQHPASANRHRRGASATDPGARSGEGLEPGTDREQRLTAAGRDPGGRVLRDAVQLRQRGLVEGNHLQHAGAVLGGRDAWREEGRTR